MKKITVFILFSCSFLNAYAAQENPVFSVDIIRHGDRTPIVPLKNSDHVWKEGQGQLTSIGLKQTHNLGVKLRDSYIRISRFLPEKYDPELMYVRSTDFDRTLISAMSLLSGLYPGTLIPVHTASVMNDDIMNTSSSKEEKEIFKAIEDEILSSDPFLIEQKNQLETKFPYWSKALGQSINTLHDLISVGNALYIHKVHQIPYPVGLSSDEAQKIISISGAVFAKIFSHKKMSSFIGARTLKYISQNLNDANSKKNKFKYVLLSGHDTTLCTLLSLMGHYLEDIPPYASILNLSLYKTKNSDPLVKITFNNQELKVPACDYQMCSLAQFLKMTENL